MWLYIIDVDNILKELDMLTDENLLNLFIWNIF